MKLFLIVELQVPNHVDPRDLGGELVKIKSGRHENEFMGPIVGIAADTTKKEIMNALHELKEKKSKT